MDTTKTKEHLPVVTQMYEAHKERHPRFHLTLLAFSIAYHLAGHK